MKSKTLVILQCKEAAASLRLSIFQVRSDRKSVGIFLVPVAPRHSAGANLAISAVHFHVTGSIVVPAVVVNAGQLHEASFAGRRGINGCCCHAFRVYSGI